MANKQFLDDDVFKYDEDDDSRVVSTKNKIQQELATPVEKNIIPTKPIMEVKKTNTNPYEERFNPIEKKKKQQRKKPLKQDVAVKKLVSISQKNLEVVKILKEVTKTYPSESEFICQAIIEKYHRENDVKEADIKTLVKDALEELVGDKYIIMKGSQEIAISNTSGGPVPKTIINQDSINAAISRQEEDENKDLLAGILGDMDDDDI